MRTTITILLTSLVWAFVIVAFFEPRTKNTETDEAVTTEVVDKTPTTAPTPTRKERRAERKAEKEAEKGTEKEKEKQTPAPIPTPAPESAPAPEPTPEPTPTPAPVTESIDYAREIDGKWTPVEGAKYPLEFTKYGTAIQYRSYKDRITYALKGQKLRIQFDNARCEITKQGGEYYLEIYNSQEYSGKYRRTSQPRKIAMRQLDESLYAKAIVGKWSVINGQEHPLEFSKYGTAIQHRSYEDRVEYTLNGSNLRIQFDNARVVISEDASYYYLEIYNSQDFSGRYRKSK